MNTQYEITDSTLMPFGIKILLIFAMLSTNFMSINKNTALAMPSLNGVGTQHTFGKNKGTPICGIYKITNPKDSIYIGQSIDCKRRGYRYACLDCKEQVKLYRSLNKYGWAAHKFEVIHECQPEELNALEVYYIALFQCFDTEHGLNLQSGGNHRRKLNKTKCICQNCDKEFYKFPSEIKYGKGKTCSSKCMGELKKGKSNYIRTPELNKSMSILKMGYKITPEAKEKMRIAQTERYKKMLASGVKLKGFIKV